MEEKVELIIIGAGPAGVSAGVYAARKQINTILITKEFGGQSIVSSEIFNWIGTPLISGFDLAKSFKSHLEEYNNKSLKIIENIVISVSKENNYFKVTTDSGDIYTTDSLMIATGSNRRKLSVPGATKYDQKGLTYCASCDGPLFTGKDVAVIGGGNAGFESAAQLLAYAKSVTLLHRSEDYKADAITVKKVLSHPKMTAITNASTTEVFGENFVKGLKYTHNGEEKTLNVEGVFVEIGLIPSTQIVEGLVDKDQLGRIKVDPYTQQSSNSMIWSSGDCTDVKFHQNNIAAGDAVKAIEHIYLTLRAS